MSGDARGPLRPSKIAPGQMFGRLFREPGWRSLPTRERIVAVYKVARDGAIHYSDDDTVARDAQRGKLTDFTATLCIAIAMEDALFHLLDVSEERLWAEIDAVADALEHPILAQRHHGDAERPPESRL